MRTLEDAIDAIARLEQRLATLNPVGTVKERDHEKGVRIVVGGTEEKPLLSPWIQPGDWSGNTRYVPEIGEQVMILSHGGDWRQATLMPLTHSDEKKNPASDIDETVHWNRDGVRNSTKKGTRTLKTDKASVTTGPDTHTIKAENTTLAAEPKRVLADANLFRATKKVILASG